MAIKYLLEGKLEIMFFTLHIGMGLKWKVRKFLIWNFVYL